MRGFIRQDVAAIRKAITAAVELEHKVIVVAHSYGGIPSNEAIRGLELTSQTSKGLSGGVSHLFFCCSFVVPEGKSLVSAFGGNDLPWLDVSADRLEVNPATPADIFYNDMTPEQVENAIADLKPHSYQTFHSVCTHAAWKTVPSTYLYCLKDAAIPIEVQKLMVETGERLSFKDGDVGRFA